MSEAKLSALSFFSTPRTQLRKVTNRNISFQRKAFKTTVEWSQTQMFQEQNLN